MKLPNRIRLFVTSAAVLFALNTLYSRAQDISAGLQLTNPTKSPAPSESIPAAGLTLATCSPDGEYYVFATANGHLKYGRTRDGTTLRTYYLCQPKAVAFSPDGRLLAAAGGSSGWPGKVKVWRIEDGALLCNVPTETGSNPRLSFSSDGLWFASTNGGSRIDLWQMPEWTLKWSETFAQNVSDISFASQDQALVVILADRSSRAMQRERADWPSWGGADPGRNMYSAGTNLPETFNPGQFRKDTETIEMATTRNVKWVAKLGSQSYGNFVVAGGKVFVGTNNATPRDPRFKDDRGILMCLDENTGAFLWQLVVPKLASGKVNDWEYLGITAAPTVVNDRVYLVTNRAEVVCLTTDGLARGNVGPFTDEGQYIAGPNKPAVQAGALDADIVWRFDLMGELGVYPHNASASALLVLGDVIYVNTGNGMDWTHKNVPSPHAPSFIALDRHTGKLLAQDDANIGPRIFHSQWSSPSSGVVNGRQLVFFGAGDGWLYAFDARPVDENGKGILKTVWKIDCNPPEYKQHKYAAPEGPSEIMATPVFFRNRVYVAIGASPESEEGVGRLLCIDATKSGDVTESGVIWDFRKIYRSLSTVSIDPASSLLFVADYSGFLYCLDAVTGQQYWRHDAEAHICGSTLVADGKVFVGDEDGDFYIFAATREKRLLGCVELPAPIYTGPIVANGALFVQTATHLFCVHQGSNAGKAEQPALLPDQPNSPSPR